MTVDEAITALQAISVDGAGEAELCAGFEVEAVQGIRLVKDTIGNWHDYVLVEAY